MSSLVVTKPCFSAFWLADRLQKFNNAALRVPGLSGVQWGILACVGVQAVEVKVVLAED